MTDVEPSKEIFRGHLEECIKHYADKLSTKHPKGSKGVAKAKTPMAQFCGVHTKSVHRWLDRGETPLGEAHIKLLCFLDLVGYRVIELERMPKGLRHFIDLIGFGLLNVNEASQRLGYNCPSALYRVARGESKVGNDKETILWDIWKENKEVLINKKLEARSTFLRGPASAKPKKPKAAPPPAPAPVPAPEKAPADIVDQPPVGAPKPNRSEAYFYFIEGALCLLREELRTDPVFLQRPDEFEKIERTFKGLSTRIKNARIRITQP